MSDTLSGEPKSIKEILNEFAKSHGLEDKLQQAKIPEVWNKVVDNKISNISKIIKFAQGTLIVSINSPTWRYELNLRKQRLRSDLNKKLGEEIVKEIIFK